MKTILDCNVVISSALSNGTCRSVLLWVLENHTLVLSEDTVLEYAQVIKREKFKAYWKPLEKLVLSLCDAGEFFTAGASSFVLVDKADEKYLALVESAQANFLVTGNTKHFPQKSYGSTDIFTPILFKEHVILKK